MNFMSSRRGQAGTRSFSQSSSPSSPSSSSSSHKILIPFSYQQQRSWLSNSNSNSTINGSELIMMDELAGEHHDSEDHDLGDSNGGASGSSSSIEREHMFDKVVTPSDVGKLNRLVIPKQHAEKYFPLDSSTNEKGLLLNFEDSNGKPWRFRYSYWNSSQSYVMTKGWSRFVKEKKLDAGDIVSFQRGVGELAKDRLFIDWRRRPDAPTHHHAHFSVPATLSLSRHFSNFHRSNVQYPSWNHPLFLQPPPPPSQYSYGIGRSSPYFNGNPCPTSSGSSLVYFRSRSATTLAPQQQQLAMMQMQRGGGGGASVGRLVEPMVFDSVPVVQGKAAAKRLRLFGVNMDCPIDECDMFSSSLPNATPHFSSSTSIPSLQSRAFYNYDAIPFQTPPSTEESPDKGKGSMSLNLDI